MPLAQKRKKKYTYSDYLQWPDDLRCELIDGIIFDMTPAPSRKHQEILGDLHLQFGSFLKNKKCNVYLAPFDIRLPVSGKMDESIYSVVQPDLTIVCDRKKLDDKGCIGAPDLIVEIVSPSTAGKDLREKYSLYERHGVKEYWIVHPIDKTVMVFKLNKSGEYSKPKVYVDGDTISIALFRGLKIDLQRVFTE